MKFPGVHLHSVKMACGENPKRVYGSKGGASPIDAHGQHVAGYRAAFIEGQATIATSTGISTNGGARQAR